VAVLLLAPGALAAREERVRQFKALVAAGLYRVDSASLARAILRSGARGPRVGQAAAGLLDTQVSA
jgi:hypothetical protein